MLKSKFAKKNQNKFIAQKYFTDRIEPRSVFKSSILSIPEKPAEIICFYGKGGIGKTTLLKKIMNISQEIYSSSNLPHIHNIFVSLDAFDYANPVNILMTIRNSIVGDCGIFDYALLQYCSKTKLSAEELTQKSNLFSSPLMEILNDALKLGTLSLEIPTFMLQKGLSLIKDLSLKRKYKEEIEEIASLNEFDIFERLPYYLGLCISHAAEKGHYHVIFLDSYESLLARTIAATPSTEQDEWLKELFLASESLRIIIASRDKLRWAHKEEGWNQYLNQYLLNNLSDEDSRWFLKQLPIKEEEIIDTIVQQAGGVPLYLDMCADIYESAINSGTSFDIHQLQKGAQIIDRYIRHLSTKNKYATKALSMLRTFDKPFALSLLKRQGIPFHPDELEELLGKSIFLPVEQSFGLWKIDESVRLHLYNQMQFDTIHNILKDIMHCISDLRDISGFRYFTVVLEKVLSDPSLLTDLQTSIIENIDFFSNIGCWNELHSILEKYVTSDNTLLYSLAVIEELIYLRRTGNLSEASHFGEMHPLDKKELGQWYYMYRYILIQLRHLQGHYDDSLLGYKALIEEMDLIRSVIPSHIYNIVSMKYADLLFLKGNFKESLDFIEHIINTYEVSIDDHIELLRIKGHIYRFNEKYEQASLIYQSALDISQASKLVAHQGKLYTNMTESYCNHNPSLAILWFNMAKEIHLKNNNLIELGKAYAAVSVAYTNLKDYDNAFYFINEAIACTTKTGYLSGRAFALAALEYYYKKTGDFNKATETHNTLSNLIHSLGVYSYILKEDNL